MEREENEEEEEESSGDEAPSPMEEDEDEWSDDEGLAALEDEEDEMDEDESDGDEAWVVSKPKTRRAPAKKTTRVIIKKRKHARKGKDPKVAAERRRATEAMLEKLDIDGLSEIDDGTLATIELESGVTLKCSVSQALLDVLWSKCEELRSQIEALVHKYERQLGEKIFVSLPRVTSLEALLSLKTVMYMHWFSVRGGAFDPSTRRRRDVCSMARSRPAGVFHWFEGRRLHNTPSARRLLDGLWRPPDQSNSSVDFHTGITTLRSTIPGMV